MSSAACVAAERQAYVKASNSDCRHARDTARTRIRTAEARIGQLKDEQIDRTHHGEAVAAHRR